MSTIAVLSWLQSPLGMLGAVATEDGLSMLQFAGPKFDIHSSTSDSQIAVRDKISKHMQKHHNASVKEGISPLLQELANQLNAYFSRKLKVFDIPLDICGTDFQMKAWNQLRQIGWGQKQSYGQQARAMGTPKAVRAVGGCNARNPVCIVIPCHRVIGSNGQLTGFAGGMERKQWLLSLETHAL